MELTYKVIDLCDNYQIFIGPDYSRYSTEIYAYKRINSFYA